MRRTAGFGALVAALFLPWAARAQDPDFVLRISTEPGVVGDQGDASAVLDFPTGDVDIAGWAFAVCHDDLVDIVTVVDGSTTAGLTPDFRAVSVFTGEGWTAGVVISFTGAETLVPGAGYELHVATYDLLTEGTSNIEYCEGLGNVKFIELSDPAVRRS